jgi:hypothetical protein
VQDMQAIAGCAKGGNMRRTLPVLLLSLALMLTPPAVSRTDVVFSTVCFPIVMRPLAAPTATPKPTPTLKPTPTQTAGPANVRVASWCSQFDAPGNDHDNLNQEYVCLENRGGSPAGMTGWRVRDEYGWTYTFPTFTLPAGVHVKLRTGCGTNTATDLYWSRTGAVWNNAGDTVYLYNAAGQLVYRYSY